MREESNAIPPLFMRQFTLRTCINFVLLSCVLCCVVVAIDQSTIPGMLLFGLAVRLLGILVAAIIVARFAVSVLMSLITALYGVVLADIILLCTMFFGGFDFDLTDRWDLSNLANNPLLVIGLLACSAAALRSRALALTVGLFLALVPPPIISM